MRVGSAVAWGTRGPELYPKGAHLFGAAMGARIKLIVDMNRRSLAIQVRESLQPLQHASRSVPRLPLDDAQHLRAASLTLFMRSRQVNDLPVVLTGVTNLPDSVRPWVLLGWNGDSAKLAGYSCVEAEA